jgi:hypothetical protein
MGKSDDGDFQYILDGKCDGKCDRTSIKNDEGSDNDDMLKDIGII